MRGVEELLDRLSDDYLRRRGQPQEDDPGASWVPDAATGEIAMRGRVSAPHRRFPGGVKAAIALAVVVVLAVLIVVRNGGTSSWPPGVMAAQSEVTTACQNPDVASEPGRVNFACGQNSRQLLWVFALMTSRDNPQFADPVNGRQGLEPITPAQGGQIAALLNLHHPYNPANPVDSIEVAARAINSIIGGATVTSAQGTPVIQPGLESSPQNCLRYTGSAAVRSRIGYPDLCARPVIHPAALATDVFLRWVSGATPATARNVAYLFSHATNPGDPQVQMILRNLPPPGA